MDDIDRTIDHESVYNRVKAHFTVHKVFYTDETINPYIRHIERLARNRQSFHPSPGDILIKLEDSSKFILAGELKTMVDNLLSDKGKAKSVKLTEYEEFINRFIRAFTMYPYCLDYLKAIPLASTAIIWPDDVKQGIVKSLCSHSMDDSKIETIKKVVKEFIEVSDKYNVNVRKWIKDCYQ